MRPVNKGSSPYEKISEYSEALPYLEQKIGCYCSYCEFPIDHVPEVEHISSKSKGGDETAWSNLLLGCKYCNSRKSDDVIPDNQGEYLWPDSDNTALAYFYISGFPRVNTEAIQKLDPSGRMLKRAENLYNLVNLGNKPSAKEKDRRFMKRIEAYNVALNSLKEWQGITDKETPAAQAFFRQTIRLAQRYGFFSMWATVFEDDPVFLHALIDAFPGTERTCFDENGRPKAIFR